MQPLSVQSSRNVLKNLGSENWPNKTPTEAAPPHNSYSNRSSNNLGNRHSRKHNPIVDPLGECAALLELLEGGAQALHNVRVCLGAFHFLSRELEVDTLCNLPSRNACQVGCKEHHMSYGIDNALTSSTTPK